MPRVLVTGGLGFLGVHTVDHWLGQGWDVHIVDNLISNAVDKDHWVDFGDRVRVVIEDVANIRPTKLPSIDLVIHLASPVGPVGILKHAGTMGSAIIRDTTHILYVSKKLKAPLLFVSTSEIYGHRDHVTYLSEDSDKLLRGNYTVRNEYSQAKLLSEIIVRNWGRINSDMRYQIIRPFNIAGANQLPDGGFVLPRFITQALAGQPLTVYGSGLQRRAFTWVRDIVDGLWSLAHADEGHWNQEWNIGNEANESSIIALAERVRTLTQSKSTISHVDPRDLFGDLFAEAPEKIPDSSKMRQAFGWSPVGDVDYVIREVIDFYTSGNV